MKQATHRWSMRVQYVVLTLLLSVGLCLLSGPLMAQAADVTPLMSKDLTDIPASRVRGWLKCSQVLRLSSMWRTRLRGRTRPC